MDSIDVLLITKSDEVKKTASFALLDCFEDQLVLHRVDTIQDAIERLEQNLKAPNFIIIDHRSASTSFLKLIFELIPDAHKIVIYSDVNHQKSLAELEHETHLIDSNELDALLPPILNKNKANLKKSSLLNPIQISPSQETQAKQSIHPPLTLTSAPSEPTSHFDCDYVAISSSRILAMRPIIFDLFLKLNSDKYLKVYRNGDEVDPQDLTKYGDQTFYITCKERDQTLLEQEKRIVAITNAEVIDVGQAKQANENSQNLLRSLIGNMGFTEEAERIAKASVNMSLKLIGAKPRLNGILNELRKKQGDFITSHSFSLGQLSCAIAHTVGWNSASTFLKLTMAAFLHDITLNINTHEREKTYEAAVDSKLYNIEELKALRLHPIKAAEFTLQFTEIPSDVEQIVAQHHEQPDGSGYPRGLLAKQIAPLSAIFIIAHDLILHLLEHPDTDLNQYYNGLADIYKQNPFRKIVAGLRKDPFD